MALNPPADPYNAIFAALGTPGLEDDRAIFTALGLPADTEGLFGVGATRIAQINSALMPGRTYLVLDNFYTAVPDAGGGFMGASLPGVAVVRDGRVVQADDRVPAPLLAQQVTRAQIEAMDDPIPPDHGSTQTPDWLLPASLVAAGGLLGAVALGWLK